MRLAVCGLLLSWSLPGTTLALNPLPTEDEFYVPPEGWRDKAHGAILKVRHSAYELPTEVENVQDTFQVMYRSIDSWGNDTWGVATVFIPNSHDIENCQIDADDPTPDCAHGMVVYQIPYDSINPNSAASWIMQFGEPYDDIGLSLGRGWFVSLTDYEGPLAAFSAGRQAGHSVLDSISPALEIARDDYGFRGNDTTTAMWGYSGGGSATGFAAEMAADYSPDLKLAGAIIGAPAPNLRSCFPLINQRDIGGLIVGSLMGMTVQRPDVWKGLLSRLNKEGPYNITTWIKGYYTTGGQALPFFAEQDIYWYFENGYEDVWTPDVAEIFEDDGVMGKHGTPNMPVFFYAAVNDGFIIGTEADDLVDTYCAGGGNVLYHRNIVGNHKSELTNGKQRALNYLGYVLDGDRDIDVPETGCRTVDVTDFVDPETLH